MIDSSAMMGYLLFVVVVANNLLNKCREVELPGDPPCALAAGTKEETARQDATIITTFNSFIVLFSQGLCVSLISVSNGLKMCGVKS
jgi:hypothetical protein